MKLILASSSPRRAEILRNAGFHFEVVAAHVDESRRPGEAPADYVRRVAASKARGAVRSVEGSAIVIGADTVVVVGGSVLGKPASAADARETLRRLSGRGHDVLSGLALIRLPDRFERIVEETTGVTFAPLSTEEIEDYISTGEPFGKAGAYAIQGRAGRFVTRVDGDYFNVMGLPLPRLYTILRELGWSADLG